MTIHVPGDTWPPPTDPSLTLADVDAAFGQPDPTGATVDGPDDRDRLDKLDDKAVAVAEKALDQLAAQVATLTAERDAARGQAAADIEAFAAQCLARAEAVAPQMTACTNRANLGTVETFRRAAAIARDTRRNTHCSTCGDTRGGPFGHETAECTWRPSAGMFDEREQCRGDELRAELAERTRERDQLAREVARMVNAIYDQRRSFETEVDRMRPVVEAAIAWEDFNARSRATFEEGGAAPSYPELRDKRRALVAAVERYQHPAVTVSPDATARPLARGGFVKPGALFGINVRETAAMPAGQAMLIDWHGFQQAMREGRDPSRHAVKLVLGDTAPEAPAGPSQQPEPAQQPDTGDQGTDDAEAVQTLLAGARHTLSVAHTDTERAEAIADLLEGWYDLWPDTAVTSPHEPIAGELVRLLRVVDEAKARPLAPVGTDTGWRALLADLRTAGWTYSIRHNEGGRDEDGAPWGDGYREHVWRRGVEELMGFSDWTEDARASLTGSVTYTPDPNVGDPSMVSISAAIAVERGPAWLREAMVLSGVLPRPLAPPGVAMKDLTDEERLTWAAAAGIARDGLLDMEARRVALAAREAKESDGLPDGEGPLPGPRGGDTGPAEHREKAAAEGRDPGVPVPGVQGLAPDVEDPLTAAIEAAGEAYEDILVPEWPAKHQRALDAAVRAAAPLIEREARLQVVAEITAHANKHAPLDGNTAQLTMRRHLGIAARIADPTTEAEMFTAAARVVTEIAERAHASSLVGSQDKTGGGE